MTPITLTKPGTLISVSGNNPGELATLPLEFTEQRHCKNKDVMAAIIDTLGDKSSSDHHVATIFKNALQHGYVTELNQIIKNITTLHGPDGVVISRKSNQLLADDGIELLRHSDGSVQLERPIAICVFPERHADITLCAERLICTDVASLLCAYDDEIAISDKNAEAIISILCKGDATEKSLVIAAASHQNQIPLLNVLLNRCRARNPALDLSRVDLSNLDLTGINLNNVNLNYANLENSILEKAMLKHATLRHANLNGANLDKAALNNADFSHARLIAASLREVGLYHTRFNGTVLLCATVETDSTARPLRKAIYQLARIETDLFPSMATLPHINSGLNVVVSDDFTEPDTTELSTSRNTVVITKAERDRLLAKGLTLDDNLDGTFRLDKPLHLHKDSDRDGLIDGTLKQIFPKELTKIISDYDDEFDLCAANEHRLLEILKSDDQLAKGQVIAAASHRFKIDVLNTLFQKLKADNVILDLSCVDLSNLQLHGINLNDAILTGACMHGCDLYQASLRRARLVGANLNGASLESAELISANLSDARLVGANLFRAKLTAARLAGAVLKFANLTRAILTGGVNLQGAYLDHARLDGAILDKADLTNASLVRTSMYVTQLNWANLTHANLTHAKLVCAQLMSANLSGADFSDSVLNSVTLMFNPTLTDTIWTRASFHRIDADPATKKKLPLRMWMNCK